MGAEAFAEPARSVAWQHRFVFPQPPERLHLAVLFSAVAVSADTDAVAETDPCWGDPVDAASRFLAAHWLVETVTGDELQRFLLQRFRVAGNLLLQVVAARSVQVVREIEAAVVFRRT